MPDLVNQIADVWIVGAGVTLVLLFIVPRALGERGGPGCSQLAMGLILWPLYYVIFWGMFRDYRRRKRAPIGREAKDDRDASRAD